MKCHANCTQEQVIGALKDRDLWPKFESKRKATWTPVSPVPGDAPRPTEKDMTHYKLGKPVKRWIYRDRDGKLLGLICRFEDSNGKTLLPLSYCQSDEGKFAWIWKSFDKPRPLYGLDELAKKPNAKVIVFEGEKATDAGRKLFPDYCCVSWPGGAKAVKYTDLTPLVSREVILWPDADEPGLACMEAIAEILVAEGSNKPKMVMLPPGLPKGWDVADDLPEGVHLDLENLVKTGIEFEPGGDKIIKQLNKRYAFVLIGGRSSILRETYDREEGKTELTYLVPESFKQFFANTFVTVGRKEIPIGTYWFTHEERRTYEGITFSPKRDVPNQYNLWRGFSYDPDPTGDWSIFREHLFENAANGNEEYFRWILGWFAQMFQEPQRKVGTSLSFRGKQGTGKTIIGKIIGALMKEHYTLVDDSRYVFGQFNSHMLSTILLHSDEGFWGGDPKHVGRLRSMVTSDSQFIELKTKDPISVPNYMRLLITTNQDWVVPAASEERRFAVFDMGDGRGQDRRYFIEMLRQMRDGGYSGLLHELLTFDLKSVDIGKIPDTAALRDQKETSMSDVAKFWLNCLIEGEIIPGEAQGWPDYVLMHRLYEAFIETAMGWGVRYRPTSNEFYRELETLLPANMWSKQRRSIGGKFTWVFSPPPLEQARKHLDELYAARFPWLVEQKEEKTGSDAVDLEVGSITQEIPF